MPNSVKAKSGAVSDRLGVRIPLDAKRKIFMEEFKEKETTLEDLEKETGFYMEEINNYPEENQAEWFDNFSKNLSGIQKVIESEDARNLFRASILESAIMRLNTLMANINGIKENLSDEEWPQVKNLLLVHKATYILHSLSK